jgi:hypothetical protein
MTSTITRPGYVSLPDFWDQHKNDKMMPWSNPHLSWSEALTGWKNHVGLRIVSRDMMNTWAEAVGGDDALDMFLFEFFYSHAVPGTEGTILFSTMCFRQTFGKRLEKLREYAIGEVSKLIELNEDIFTPNDIALLRLFELCFPNVSEGMAWFHFDKDTDLFLIADLLRAGIPARSIPIALANDIDVSLMTDLVGDFNV